MKVYLATDHAGFELKNVLVAYVATLGHEAVDCGALAYDIADDYPDFIAVAAKSLSKDIATGVGSRAIIIGASGQGEAMAANRFTGVRCALYYGEPTKKQTDASGNILDMLASTRAHNHANALSLGARFLSEEECKNAVKRFLELPQSADERHVRRVAKLDMLTK